MTAAILSVIIITKNEGQNIRNCLSSVKWADEIIVLDSGSTDDTCNICREFTQHVQVMDWPGYGPQKKRACALASGNWILSIDADESVTPELADEIRTVIQQDKIHGYYLKRQNTYCGKLIRHGNWKNDKVMRLFQRSQGEFTNDIVHEKVIVKGPTATLQAPLIHYTHPDLHNGLNKMNHYTTLIAQLQHAGTQKASLSKAIFHGLWTFLKGYILRCGFLDGKHGFLLAVLNAEGSFYKYAKTLLLQNKVK